MPIPSRREALDHLAELTSTLSSSRVQLADLESSAHRIRVESWMASDSEYVSARDRVADFNALDLTCDIITLKGEIQAAADEIKLYELVVTWGSD